MSFFVHLGLILKKTLFLKSKEPVKSVVELLVPLVFTFLFAVGYWVSDKSNISAKTYVGDSVNASALVQVAAIGFCRTDDSLPSFGVIGLCDPNAKVSTVTVADDITAVTDAQSAQNVNSPSWASAAHRAFTTAASAVANARSAVEPAKKDPGLIPLPAPFQGYSVNGLAGVTALGGAAALTEPSHRHPVSPFSLDMFLLLSNFQVAMSHKIRVFNGASGMHSLGHAGQLILIGDKAKIDSFRAYCFQSVQLCPKLLFPNDGMSMDAAVSYAKKHGGKIWAILDLSTLNFQGFHLNAAAENVQAKPDAMLAPMSQTSPTSTAQTRDMTKQAAATPATAQVPLQYTIRMNYTATPFTNNAEWKWRQGTSHDTTLYINSGFITLQTLVDSWILNVVSGGAQPVVSTPIEGLGALGDMSLGSFPTRAFATSNFIRFGAGYIPLVMTFGFLYSLSRLLSLVVEEKESRIREAMLIMGLRPWSFNVSWLIVAFVSNCLACFLPTLLGIGTFFKKVDPIMLFITHLMFANMVSAFGLLLSTFFSRARVAALVGPLLMFASTIPHFAMPQDSTLSARYAVSILPGTAYAEAIQDMANYVSSGAPATWSSLFADKYSIGAAWIVMTVVSFVYLVLAWYLDQVFPSEVGARRHPLFFLPCFGFGQAPSEAELEAEAAAVANEHSANFEPCTNTADPAVRVLNLTKKFGDHKAVNQLSLDMHQGEILVLLGHNGAGKSTTMHMVTGMLSPTSGDVKIFGSSVRNDLEKCRRNVGFCPQHNILWPSLSVRFHLQFFARMKGMDPADIEEAVRITGNDVDLWDQIDVKVAALSGGQKRKLSVGIALIGGSEFVLLDEPTAGMDVAARRHLWNLLMEQRRDRCVLLSTHYMDEADLLGDRIAIMDHGVLHSFGTSLFLKSTLGVGYKLHCVAEDRESIARVKAFVSDRCSEAMLVPSGSASTDATFKIPKEFVDDGARSGQFFAALEDPQTAPAGMRTFGLALTTLEDVFLKIADPAKAAAADLEAERVSQCALAMDEAAALMNAPHDTPSKAVYEDGVNDNGGAVGYDPVDGEAPTLVRSIPRHFTCMFMKRVHCAKRDVKLLVFQVILPVAFIGLAFLVGMLGPPDMPSLSLTDVMYKSDRRSEEVMSASNRPFGEELASSLRRPPYTPIYYASNVTNATVAMRELSDRLLDEVLDHGAMQRRWAVSAVPASNATTGFYTYAETTVLINSTADHGAAQAVSSIATAAVRKATPMGNYYIDTINHPMPMSELEQKFVSSMQKVITSIFILIPFTFIPAQFVAYIVRERETKAKHQQWVSGASPLAYWASTYCFDLLSYMVTVTLAIIIFLIFHRTEFVGGADTFFATLTLFTAYGASMIPCSYVISFAFEKHTSAQNVVMMGNFICGFILVLAAEIMASLNATKHANMYLVWIYRLVPSFALGEGIVQLSEQSMHELFGPKPTPFAMLEFHDQENGGYFSGGVGTSLVYLCVTAPLYFLLLFVQEAFSFGKIVLAIRNLVKSNSSDNGDDHEPLIDGTSLDTTEEEDVAQERREVEQGREGDCLTVNGLTKVYTARTPPKVAVNNVTFGVKTGEIFAFLGTNGAGKTTTMSILTGDVVQTAGRAAIGGYDVTSQSEESRMVLGYCPQFDSLTMDLTPDEHMFLYSRLKGVPEGQIQAMSDKLLTALGVFEFKNKPAGSLSGGNKRKLSIAIALVGDPQVVLLDEPSAGMDPVARRELWKSLQKISQRRSVVLTTHHLEEVEALATRVAIMVSGSLQCIGTLQHLKSKYGQGAYEVEARCESEADFEGLVATATEHLQAKLVEQHGAHGTMSFVGTPLSRIFPFMAEARQKHRVCDFSVNQPSIEQVFLRISNTDIEEVLSNDDDHQA